MLLRQRGVVGGAAAAQQQQQQQLARRLIFLFPRAELNAAPLLSKADCVPVRGRKAGPRGFAKQPFPRAESTHRPAKAGAKAGDWLRE